MAHGYDTMINPAIEDLLERTESKFVLVTLASRRSREITDYWSQTGVGIGAIVPPQVVSTSSKALSIALEEIAESKIVAMPTDEAADGSDGDGSDDPTDRAGQKERSQTAVKSRATTRGTGTRT